MPDGSWTATDADISGLTDGPLTVDADVSDIAGNDATNQEPITLDTSAMIAITGPVETDDIVNATEVGDVVIAGTTAEVDPGQTVTVTISDGVNTVTTTATVEPDGTWTTPDVDLSALNQGELTIQSDVTDNAGNVINSQEPITLDQIIPTVDTITSNDITPMLTGTIEPGETITISVDSDGDGIPEVVYTVMADTNGDWSIDPDLTTPDSGAFPTLQDMDVIDIVVIDPAGNIAMAMIQIDLNDEDGDGINDIEEESNGTDPLDPCDPNPLAVGSADCDGDGVPNDIEIGDDPNTPLDTDEDGIPDVLDPDDDGDGIPTSEENPDPNGDSNPDDAFDSDGDGIPDYLEENNTDSNAEDGIEVFNIVTPNGDGDHDTFVISNLEKFVDNEMRIFNRWGVLVYETNGYGQSGEFFRGVSNGRVTVSKEEELPVGTYFYILTYKTSTGETKKRSDYLYLNR